MVEKYYDADSAEDLPERLRYDYMKKKVSWNFDFALTSYCQAKCRSCTRMDQERPPEMPGLPHPALKLEHFSLDVFKKIISGSKIIGSHNDYIQFCGELGDPCMHPQIEDFVEVAFEYGGGVHINTNGGLRKPEWYAHMAEKFDTSPHDRRKLRMKFGIDGTDHETNWKYRDGVDWQRAMDNMTAWFTHPTKPDGEWHFILFEWNWHQIEKAQQMADDIGCDIIFKFNTREWGKISNENKLKAMEVLEQIGADSSL